MCQQYKEMRIALISIISVFLLMTTALKSQSIPQGISYQAVLYNEDGALMRGKEIKLRISLTDGPNLSKVYYLENQVVQTDQTGTVNLILGQANLGQDILRRVPWAEKDIWMNIDLLKPDGSFKTVSQGSFTTVPYAFHAKSTAKLIPQDTARLRTNQSIIWNTSGNYKTQPDVHFLGTVDSQALYFKTSDVTRMVINANGQTTYYTDDSLDGTDTVKSAYPLVIQGGNQGIYLEIQESRTTANNFLTFADPDGIHGTVQGQTAGEFYSSYSYIFPMALKVADIAIAVANTIAGAVEAGGLAAAASAAAPTKAEFIANLAKAISTKTIQLISWNIEKALTIGVQYKTGSADYAEWLEKASLEEDFMPGEVVGVHNGKISRTTEGAEKILVVSSDPGILGNMPLETETYKYEKIAFMGQVAVFVAGEVNAGDYILPSGNEDGIAIAVAPEDMQAGAYENIIGVAWEASKQGPLNLVKVAIGINTNDLAQKVAEVEQKLDLIMDYLQGKGQLENGKLLSGTLVQDTTNTSIGEQIKKYSPFYSDETYYQFLDEHAATYQAAFDESARQLEGMGIDLSKYPELQRLYNDPVPYFKEMRTDPRMQTYMGYFDESVRTKFYPEHPSNH